MIDLVEAAGLLLLTVVVGGTLFDIYGERGFKKRRNTRSATSISAPTESPALPLPYSADVDAFLEPMEPVRRALQTMPEAQRELWRRKAAEVLVEVRDIDQWLHAVSTWAPHQRETVYATAEAKVHRRQTLINEFARDALQGGLIDRVTPQ